MSEADRNDHDLREQQAECAFCGEIVARKKTCGKLHLLTVHMTKCLKHPYHKLDEQYRALSRQKSGREREIEILGKENKGLRDALRKVENHSSLVGSNWSAEEALKHVGGLAIEALKRGGPDAE